MKFDWDTFDWDLLDKHAGHALAGLLAAGEHARVSSPEDNLAQKAYAHALAMLRQRESLWKAAQASGHTPTRR